MTSGGVDEEFGEMVMRAMMNRSRNEGGKRCYVYTLMWEGCKARLMRKDHSVMRENDEAR
jgi:hypothetical protein